MIRTACLVLFFFFTFQTVSCIKIAFVGDTGMEDVEHNGYGHLTMKMIDEQNVDLVIDVGDFDYWGQCTEKHFVTTAFDVYSTFGRIVNVPVNSTLQRYKYQDGRFGSIEGWEIGVEQQQEEQISLGDLRNDVSSSKSSSTKNKRIIISERMWNQISQYLVETDDCWGEPWDGPYKWNQFLRGHNFAFLGASGNAELMEIGKSIDFFVVIYRSVGLI